MPGRGGVGGGSPPGTGAPASDLPGGDVVIDHQSALIGRDLHRHSTERRGEGPEPLGDRGPVIGQLGVHILQRQAGDGPGGGVVPDRGPLVVVRPGVLLRDVGEGLLNGVIVPLRGLLGLAGIDFSLRDRRGRGPFARREGRRVGGHDQRDNPPQTHIGEWRGEGDMLLARLHLGVLQVVEGGPGLGEVFNEGLLDRGGVGADWHGEVERQRGGRLLGDIDRQGDAQQVVVDVGHAFGLPGLARECLGPLQPAAERGGIEHILRVDGDHEGGGVGGGGGEVSGELDLGGGGGVPQPPRGLLPMGGGHRTDSLGTEQGEVVIPRSPHDLGFADLLD